jgi:hypothetical protein
MDAKKFELRDQPAYALAEAAQYLKLPAATLRSWTFGRPYPKAGKTVRFQPLIRPASKAPPLLSMRVASLLPALLLVAGCGGTEILFTRDYRAPPSSQTATLRFDMLPRALVGIYADDRCMPTEHGTFVNGHVRPGNPTFVGGHIKDVVGVPVPTTAGLTVSFSSLENLASAVEITTHGKGFTRKCNVTLTFDPRQGATYEGVYRFESSTQKCTAEIVRIENAGGVERRVPEPTARPAKERCVLLS